MGKVLSNIKKFVALISFWGSVVLGFYFIRGNYKTWYYPVDIHEIILPLILYVTVISTVLNILLTNFTKQEQKELDKLDYENQVLQKQIEQKALKEKLNT